LVVIRCCSIPLPKAHRLARMRHRICGQDRNSARSGRTFTRPVKTSRYGWQRQHVSVGTRRQIQKPKYRAMRDRRREGSQRESTALVLPPRLHEIDAAPRVTVGERTSAGSRRLGPIGRSARYGINDALLLVSTRQYR
jgi:hypothetical protein